MQQLVAVCICTRARPQMMRRCLKSVIRQELPGRRVAVIVIDNDPAASARAVFDECLPAPTSNQVYAHCTEVGIPIARNAAMDVAVELGADRIVFIDDDEVAPPGWLEALWDAMTQSGADALQGSVRQMPAGSDLEAVAIPPGDVTWEDDESLATNNVIFKADLVRPPLSLRFDETMRFSGGSDREYFMRAHKRGAKVVRAYGADVLEELAVGRETLRYLCLRSFAAGCNYNTRMMKNEPVWRAVPRIALRTIDRALSGVLKQVQALVMLILFQPSKAWQITRKGCANFSFALGCLTPLVGVRANLYGSVQGS